MKEIWNKLEGFEYEVSNLGRVKSLKRNLILSQRKDHAGYYYVNIYGEKRKTIKVHQLVAIAFLGHKPCGLKLVVDHINNDKTDNRVENLQLISCTLNNQKDKRNLGISYHKWHKKFLVRIEGKSYGWFSNLKDAEEKRNKIYENL